MSPNFDQRPRARPVPLRRGAALVAAIVLAGLGHSSAGPAETASTSPPGGSDPGSATAGPVAVPSGRPTAVHAGRAATQPAGKAFRAVPLGRSAPVRVDIPAIGVTSELMGLGLQDDGTMEVPPAAFPAGWYTGAPTPGELGPAVLAGHVNWDDAAGVFADLGDLRRGDRVNVSRADGSTAVFRVTRSEQFDKKAFPTELVYGDIDHAGLRLITCSGLDRGTGRYRTNLVVFAELVRRLPER